MQTNQALKSTLQIKIDFNRVDLQPQTPKGFKVAPIFEEEKSYIDGHQEFDKDWEDQKVVIDALASYSHDL